MNVIDNLIEAHEICKSYWLGSVETPVLKGVDLSIGRQDLLAIVGSSGAGKSTLLHVLSTLDVPTSGSVRFENEEVSSRNDEELSQLRNQAIGFVFQFHHLMPEFTALENVVIPLLIRGRYRDTREKGMELLERLGLAHRADHRPPELSGGEQQRVAVARAVIQRPRVLFLDEPTGNLDHENSEKLMDLLLQLYDEEKMAVVMVTHNETVASRFSKKVFLEDGRILRTE